MVRWLRWHCPPDTRFEIRALAVWGRARYLSVTEAPHNTNFHTWMGKKQFCFFQTAETGNRTPDSGVKGSGANHYPRAPALIQNDSAGSIYPQGKACLLHNYLKSAFGKVYDKGQDEFPAFLLFVRIISVVKALTIVTCLKLYLYSI